MTLGEWFAGLLAAAFSYIENTNINWRLMLSAGSFPIAIQLVYFRSIPESPRWLISRNQPSGPYITDCRQNESSCNSQSRGKDSATCSSTNLSFALISTNFKEQSPCNTESRLAH
uniref:Major facilitator superfamily (MFS) profile domain-containing protein n=1 Tax=Trichuris muris TaxID=70415 RepID=A0A5S6QU42_TRIMR